MPKQEINLLTKEFEDLSEYIQDLWHFLPLPIFNINPQGVILDANNAFEALAGWTLPETIGEPLNYFFSPQDAKEIISQTLQKKFLRAYDAKLKAKNKENLEVAVYAQARTDKTGNIIGFFAALIDIRENKKFQEELEKRVAEKTREIRGKTQELEASSKALMNILEDVDEAKRNAEAEKNKTFAIIINFTDGLLFFDKNSELSLVNPQAEEILAVKKENLIGKAIAELAAMPSLGHIISLFDDKKQTILRNEIEIRKDQNIEVSIIPVMLDEEFLGTMVIIHDVTREKLIERMKTEFVSLTAHQLRTPLSAIKWTLRMFLDGDLGQISEEQKNFLQKTYASNERMIHLINDLLNVARIEEGKFIHKLAPGQISDIVQSVINSFQDKINLKKIDFQYILPKKKIPLVKLDPEKMNIAITNLLDNAIDYTPENGKITIDLSFDKNAIQFAIKDSGVGIPKDQQHRIFSKFFRGENVVKMETDGTGLGTFIAKNIIEAHGGKIWFESPIYPRSESPIPTREGEGAGTAFYFTLPL